MYRLLERGCPRETASSALEDAWDNKLWLEPLRDELDTLERRKGEEYAVAKMKQKGFSYSEIREAKESNE